MHSCATCSGVLFKDHSTKPSGAGEGKDVLSSTFVTLSTNQPIQEAERTLTATPVIMTSSPRRQAPLGLCRTAGGIKTTEVAVGTLLALLLTNEEPPL